LDTKLFQSNCLSKYILTQIDSIEYTHMEFTEFNYRTIDYVFSEESVVQWKVSGGVWNEKRKKHGILR